MNCKKNVAFCQRQKIDAWSLRSLLVSSKNWRLVLRVIRSECKYNISISKNKIKKSCYRTSREALQNISKIDNYLNTIASDPDISENDDNCEINEWILFCFQLYFLHFLLSFLLVFIPSWCVGCSLLHIYRNRAKYLLDVKKINKNQASKNWHALWTVLTPKDL